MPKFLDLVLTRKKWFCSSLLCMQFRSNFCKGKNLASVDFEIIPFSSSLGDQLSKLLILFCSKYPHYGVINDLKLASMAKILFLPHFATHKGKILQGHF